MKRIALSLCLAALACASTANAAAPDTSAVCTGNHVIQDCVDESGNNYTVQHFGNTTPVNEKPPRTGAQSDGFPTTAGSTSFLSGVTPDGANWNETITDYGNGTRTISGMAGNGVVYTHYCTVMGCN